MRYHHIILLFLNLFAWNGIAQQIILDKPVKAGDLTLFPDMNDQSQYYYIADQARLAVDDNGKPEFSFLRYVDGSSAQSGSSIGEVGGGGIIHAVISLAVTEAQINKARQALKRVDPNGKLMGPAIFKSGRFALVSSFNESNGTLAKQVIGVGKAPILDGQKAAVSVLLTKLGSQLLWESFKTNTPDISFSFEMTLEGFRLPKRAVIEANFEDIYRSFDLGIQAGYQYAVGQNQSAKKEKDTSPKPKAETKDTKPVQKSQEKKKDSDNEEKKSKVTDEKNNNKKKIENNAPPSESVPAEDTLKGNNDKVNISTPSTEPEKLETKKDTSSDKSQEAIGEDVMGGGLPPRMSTKTAKNNEEGIYIGAKLQYVFEELRKTGAIKVEQYGDDEDIDKLVNTAYNKLSDLMFDKIESNASTQPDVSKMLGQLKPNEEPESNLNGLLISFTMKKKRRTGKFRFDLNKWTNDNLVMRFDHNIGTLHKYQNDEKVFKMVNLDDPAYQQREIISIIDGYNAEDFGEYINFVSVHLRKKHEKGAITDKEIIIDRNNFNQQGNNFSMVYGWNGDDNRSKWMNYEYEVLWSFFGDVERTEPFQTSTFNAINLAPPYQKQVVEIEADPSLLEGLGVRMILVKLYYQVEGKEFMKQATLIPHKEMLSDKIEYISAPSNLNYEYEITWRLKGNKVIESGRLSGSDNFLFVDELPE